MYYQQEVITSSVPVTETNLSILSWHSSLLGTSMSSSESDDDESLMMMQDLVQLDVEVVYGRDRRDFLNR